MTLSNWYFIHLPHIHQSLDEMYFLDGYEYCPCGEGLQVVFTQEDEPCTWNQSTPTLGGLSN